jgi:hypothetical protein
MIYLVLTISYRLPTGGITLNGLSSLTVVIDALLATSLTVRKHCS